MQSSETLKFAFLACIVQEKRIFHFENTMIIFKIDHNNNIWKKENFRDFFKSVHFAENKGLQRLALLAKTSDKPDTSAEKKIEKRFTC